MTLSEKSTLLSVKYRGTVYLCVSHRQTGAAGRASLLSCSACWPALIEIIHLHGAQKEKDEIKSSI